jgi:hypothetical protein
MVSCQWFLLVLSENYENDKILIFSYRIVRIDLTFSKLKEGFVKTN